MLAGGRYDGLIGTMGGPETPGVGWAAGVERLAMLTDEPAPPPRPIAIIPLGEAADRRARQIAHELRHGGAIVDLGYSGNLKRRLARASRANARIAVILGEDELQRGVATTRDMDSGEQQDVPLTELSAKLLQS